MKLVSPARALGLVAGATAAVLAGTLLAASPPAAEAAAPSYFTALDTVWSAEFKGHRYFFADDDRHGLELWRTNGTKAGTELFLDNNPGDADSDGFWDQYGDLNSWSQPRLRLVSTANKLYLLGAPIISGQASPGVYRIDTGTAPKLVKLSGASFRVIANLGTRVLLVSNDRLYSLDSESDSITLISGVSKVSTPVSHPDLVSASVKGVGYFQGYDAAGDQELWRSDGTQSGTYRLKNIRSSGSAYPDSFVAGKNRFYFVADDGSTGRELWTSDGTEKGTIRLTDHEVNTGNARFVVNQPNLVTVGDRLYYYLATTEYGAELWTANGTRSSVKIVRDLNKGRGSANIKHLTAVGDKLAFFRPGNRGDDLWVTNGTAKGTVKIQTGTDLGSTIYAAQYYRRTEHEPVAVAGQLVFNRAPSQRQSIWQSGSVSGTDKRIANHAGLSGRPTQLLPVGKNRLFYTTPTQARTFGPTHYQPRFLTITPKKPPATFRKTGAPKITGTARVGKKLTAKVAAWRPGARFSYRWYANGKRIPKATKKSYSIATKYRGKRITVKVTGKRSGYTTVVKTSKATKRVAARKR